MMKISKGKLNIVFGKVDSGKTTLLLNEISEQSSYERDIIFFSPDTKANLIEKKIHCMVNKVNLTTVKYDKKTLEPKNLTLPVGLEVIDNCRDFKKIKSSIESIVTNSNDPLIVIDNINQIDFKFDESLSYKDKVTKMFDLLSDLAIKLDVDILVSFYMLMASNWEDDNNISSDDDKLGNIFLIDKDNNNNIQLYNELNGKVNKFSISPYNLLLEEV